MNTDDPDQIEPALAKLGEWLPPARLVALRAAVRNFDFEGSKGAVRALAADLRIPLEEPQA